MRVSVVTDDNLVVVDGKGKRIDCSELVGRGIRAMQWYDDEGEIEFEGTRKHRPPNEIVTDFKLFEPFYNAWVLKNDN